MKYLMANKEMKTGDLKFISFSIEFVPSLEYNNAVRGEKVMEYLTSNEIAEKWDISSCRVRKLCGNTLKMLLEYGGYYYGDS